MSCESTWKRRNATSCHSVASYLHAYADHTLAAPLRRGVIEHLGGCRRCRRIVSDTRQMLLLLRRLPARPVPASMKTALLDALHTASAQHSTDTVASRTTWP